MIRFSAGLVVVALGVLIGGVATSKLSLVYVSIAISALALVAWAVGVFLKRGELREELFGGRSELAPAGAGASAGVPAPERLAPAPAAPSEPALSEPAPVGVAAATAAPPVAPAPSAGQERPAYGRQLPSFSPAAPFPASSAGTPARPTWTLREPAAPAAPASAGPAARVGSVAGAAAGGDLRSWFDRPAKPAEPDSARDKASAPEPAAEDTVAVSVTSAPANVTSPPASVTPDGDDDDDWPTRYTWLDDEDAGELDDEDAGEPADSDESATTESATTGEPLTPGEALTSGAALASEEASASELAATSAADELDDNEPGSGGKLVTVVPGVPRYHEPDCILIRFMPEDDVQRKSIPEAEAANCTPCAACQPEG